MPGNPTHLHIKKDTRGCLFSLGLLNASNAEKKKVYICDVLSNYDRIL